MRELQEAPLQPSWQPHTCVCCFRCAVGQYQAGVYPVPVCSLTPFQQLPCLFSDSGSNHRGPSALWKQCQTCSEGSRVWTDSQDQDQEGEQPLL